MWETELRHEFWRGFLQLFLLAHRAPVLKIIEQNSIKDMQEQEDIAFLDHAKACAGMATLRLNETPAATCGFLGFTTGAQVDAFFKGATPVANPRTSNIILSPNNYFRRDTIADMAKIQLARQLELKVFLMSAQDFVDTLRWFADEVGHDVATKITIGGYKEATVGGYTFVTTIKTNRRLVQPGHIYGFADKTALGKFLILTAPKFWIVHSISALAEKRTGTHASRAPDLHMLHQADTATVPVPLLSKSRLPDRRHPHVRRSLFPRRYSLLHGVRHDGASCRCRSR